MSDDWISPWWQAVLLPDRWDVCGVTAPSLSVWHTYALENIGNRFVCGGDPEKDDCASMLLFASHDFAGGRRLMLGENYRAKQTRRIYKRLRDIPDAECIAECLEYAETCMRHGTRRPPQSGAGTPAGTPEAWAIVAGLCGVGWSRDDAWNEPYATARAFLDAQDERSGNAVMTPSGYGEWYVDHWADVDQVATREVVLN